MIAVPTPGGGKMAPAMPARIRPFRGTLSSTAFHVRDAATFETDAAAVRLRRGVDIFSGQRPQDSTPCFCLARRMAPPPPLLIRRQPGEAIIAEGGAWDPEVDDADGWIALLQGHLDPVDAIVVTECGSPDSPHVDLLWVITVTAVRCCESTGRGN